MLCVKIYVMLKNDKNIFTFKDILKVFKTVLIITFYEVFTHKLTLNNCNFLFLHRTINTILFLEYVSVFNMLI